MLGGSLLEVAKFNRQTTVNDRMYKLIVDKAKEAEKHTKFVLENSKMMFMMPKIKLIVPTNLELETSLSMKLSTDFSYVKDSKEQHCIEYTEKFDEDTG